MLAGIGAGVVAVVLPLFVLVSLIALVTGASSLRAPLPRCDEGGVCTARDVLLYVLLAGLVLWAIGAVAERGRRVAADRPD